MQPIEEIRQSLREQINRIRPTLHLLEVGQVLSAVYPRLLPAAGKNESSEPTSISGEIDRCMEVVAKLPPQRATIWQTMSTELGLTDLERIIVYVAVLRKMPYETVWIHFGLVEALNRLLTGGVSIARVPCIVHSLLAVNRHDGDRLYEPMPRSILVRELEAMFPRDAITNGLEALSLGYMPPYKQTVKVAAALGVVSTGLSSSANLSTLRTIADKCELGVFKRAQTISVKDSPARPPRIIVPAEVRTLPLPRGDSSHYLFREAQKPIALPAIAVHDIKNGTISFDVSHRGRTTFYVFDENEVCLSQLSQGLNPFILNERFSINGTLAVLGDQYSGPLNICHFLLDHMSRIALYESYCTDQSISYTLFAGHQYYLDVASMAGYGDQIVSNSSSRVTMRAERLLVSSNIIADFRHPAHLCASWAVNFLRDKLRSDKPLKKSRRVFISRAEDAKGRQIINRNEVEQLVRSFGYEIMALGSMCAREQRDLFAEASHVAGVHGAGLSNVLFSNKGTKVLEILPALVATPAYWTLCSQIGLDYYALIATDPDYPRPNYKDWGHHEEFNSRNLLVPIGDLHAVLTAMEHANG